jgi:hypothetical protein
MKMSIIKKSMAKEHSGRGEYKIAKCNKIKKENYEGDN